jgi:hypothetical protein
VLDGEEPDDQHRGVDLGTSPQERDLVAQPEETEEPEQDRDARRGQLAG